MKLKFMAISAIAILGVTTFIACKKESQPSSGMKYQKISSTNSLSECPTINFSELNIGQFHNVRIADLYNGVNINNFDSARQQIIDNFENFDYQPTVLGISREDYNNLSMEILDELEANQFDIRNYSDASVTSSSAFPYLCQIMDEIDNLVDLNQLNAALDVIEADAIEGLSCQDLDVVIGTLKIARSSAELWLPVELGGQGYNKGGPVILSGAKDTIKKAIIGDASALSASFIRMGTMIAIGLEVPGANMAILVGLALDAILGSAFAAFL